MTGLFLVFDYDDSTTMNIHIQFFYGQMLIFLMLINSGLEGWWFFKFYEKMPDHFPKQLCHFTLPSMMCEHSSCSPSLPTYYVVSLNFSHSDGCRVLAHCDFNLH